MGDYSKYRDRLSRNGQNVGEVYENNTNLFIESKFSQSPTFRILDVNSYENPTITVMDARVIKVERLGSLREILFRPSSNGLNVGAYVSFDDETWLIFDKYDKRKVLAEKCNRTLKWKDMNGILLEFDCIASSMDLGSKAKQAKNEIEWNKFDVRLPVGQLFVFIEARDETKSIGLNHRFIFGKKVYEVVGIDDTTMVDKNGFGIIQFVIKVTTIKEEDNFETGIAFNFYDDSSTVEPIIQSERDDGKGGRIW